MRETITHELLHCLLTEMEIAFRYAINGLGAEAQQIALDHWNDAEELAVARLAAALYDDGEGQ